MSTVSSDWRDEANAVIRDVREHVAKITVSRLPCMKQKIYFNLTTLESKDFCVELTQRGFRIVGEKYDSCAQEGKYSVFETPYSMLDSLSPAYRNSFKEQLVQRLNSLQEQMSKEDQNKEDEGKERKEDHKT